ncbi:tetratricopeptide repeat protein [Streptomyces sp. NPDC006798]|uniref:tetratricopeptide repeat protein n=1 Tax=Streptomyces sp. NPDC006798 TaxID=3155462 RepID=UPI0033E743C9
MTTMTVEEIRRGLLENARDSHGPARTARAESLGAAAESAGDPGLFRQSLMGLIDAYEYSAERTKMVVPFARLLQEYDRDPAAFGSYEVHSLFWRFKWVTGGIVDSPDVPLDAVERWLVDMERRYRLAGHSARAVRQAEHVLAEATGDEERTERAFAAWLAADRDSMSDCHACELNDQGRYRARRGEDAEAVRIWTPVLDNTLTCMEEPHRVLALSLLPLLRLGRADEARSHHLRGYRLARGNESLLRSIGAHIEFCALTGNEARGLEILSEHAGHLGSLTDVEAQMDLNGGVLVLLRRLRETGHGDRPTVSHQGAVRTVTELYDLMYADATGIAARFDLRNGTTHVSELLAERIARRPLVDALPLGVRSPRLSPAAVPSPRPAGDAAADGGEPSGASAAVSAVSGVAAVAASSAPPSFAELVERARAARRQGHPTARARWAEVARRAGSEPGAADDPALAADLLEAGAGDAAEDGAPEATGRFLEAARAHRAAGRPSRAAYTELAAAGAAARSGAPGQEIAELLAAAVRSAGELDVSDPTRERRVALAELAELRLGPVLRHRAAETTTDPEDPAEVGHEHGPEEVDPVLLAGLDAFVAARSAAVSPAGAGADPYGTVDVLAQAELTLAHLLLPAGEPERAAALLTSAAERFIAAGRPWEACEPLSVRAGVVAALGDAEAAEAAARAALGHAAELTEPHAQGSVRLTLASVLIRSEDGAAEAADLALDAAHWFDQAGRTEGPGSRARLLLAEAYARTDRAAEAVEVLHSILPDLVAEGDDEEIVGARRMLGRLLQRVGDPRGAAEQYLLAADAVTGWEDPAPQASLANTAAEALAEAGVVDGAEAAYLRALELWRRVGDSVVAEVRVLRSLAWLRLRADTSLAEYGKAHAFMAEALTLVQEAESPELRYEWAQTCFQLARLLTAQTPETAAEEAAGTAAGDEEGAGETIGAGASAGSGSGDGSGGDGQGRAEVLGRAIGLLDRAAELFAEFGLAAVYDRFDALARAAWTEHQRDGDAAKDRMKALVAELEQGDGEESAELLEDAREMLAQM